MRQVMLPIHKIEKGSNIVLYGAGNIGKAIWNINQSMNWCNICMVLDKQYNNIKDFPIKVDEPESIMSIDTYEYVLIAISSRDYRREVEERLISYGVDKRKIINNISYISDDEQMIVDEWHGGDENVPFPIRIAFRPIGSMGDLIISLKVYQQMIKAEEKCCIDVFVDNIYVAKSIFYLQEKLGKIIKYNENVNMEEYDIYLETRFVPYLRKCNFLKLQKVSVSLANMMREIYAYQRKYQVDCEMFQYSNRILVDRAKFANLNRYELFNISGGFNIKDTNVDFYINDKYMESFYNLGLNTKYITYNYGAHDQNGDGTPQVKLWPYEYHIKLNEMIKIRFPDYELIQLGGNEAKKIPGADRYILGEALDVVKYILKYSSLHFDCEGGLVHMATQLKTKCVVMFGPTPVWFYGYKGNINISPKICGECKGLYYDWYTVCHKFRRPECMWSIKPEKVFAAIESVLA